MSALFSIETLSAVVADIAGASHPTQKIPGIREKGLWTKEREFDRELEEEDDPRTQDDDYCNITLGKRIIWLRRRSEALSIIEAVSRLQTRRTARQVGEIAVALYEYGDTIEDMDEGVQDIEVQLSKLAGIRRVN